MELQPEFYRVHCIHNPSYKELLVCGLYRLGFEDESILSQLPELTAHEKLDLRLTMPREFWPKRWIDEEKSGGE